MFGPTGEAGMCGFGPLFFFWIRYSASYIRSATMLRAMRFSERQGIRPLKKIVQIDSMDDDLRNRLWNVLTKYEWPVRGGYYDDLTHYPELNRLLHDLWHNYFKEPLDTIPSGRRDAVAKLRKYYLACDWYAAYDFLEFVLTHRVPSYKDKIIGECNKILEEELSGYRFVSGRFVPVSSKEEICAIDRAIAETATVFPPATKHLQQAIALLAQKPTPDYRNSIKESISAVESVCVAITGDTKATLGSALKIIESKAALHGALKSAFDKLYGYTSDADGIRHALLDEPRLELEDAVFMLVACSAFVSYVIAKRGRKA